MFDRARALVERAERGSGQRDVADVVAYLTRGAPLVPTRGVRERINAALRTASDLVSLRAHMIQLSSELKDTERDEPAPETERAPIGYPLPWEGDTAPNTPRDPHGNDDGV